MKITDFVLNFLFPEKCGICDCFNEKGICENCYKKIQDLREFNIEADKYALFKYEGIIRSKLIQFKFEDKSYLKKMFAEFILKDKDACEFINNYDVIVPVPVHFKRYLERGYNQTLLILKELKNYRVETNILIKRVNTKPQSTKNIKEREMKKGVFEAINNEKIKGKRVLVFDDIFTTGNTFKESKRALIKGGAKAVGILTIARAELKILHF